MSMTTRVSLGLLAGLALGMFRTTANVTGAMAAAVVLDPPRG